MAAGPAERAVGEIFAAVVALGGTITGEHGVGLTQRAYLGLRHSPEVLAAMQVGERPLRSGRAPESR